jgi:hypothetical protein
MLTEPSNLFFGFLQAASGFLLKVFQGFAGSLIKLRGRIEDLVAEGVHVFLESFSHLFSDLGS